MLVEEAEESLVLFWIVLLHPSGIHEIVTIKESVAPLALRVDVSGKPTRAAAATRNVMSALDRVFASDWRDSSTSAAYSHPLSITDKTPFSTLDGLAEFIETLIYLFRCRLLHTASLVSRISLSLELCFLSFSTLLPFLLTYSPPK